MSGNPPSSGPAERLWVPGLVFVAEDGEIVTGTHVGFNGRRGGFRYCGRCGKPGRLDDWTGSAYLVPRAALTPTVVAEHAIILAETLVDQDAQPHARRWLASQPLVCVSGLKQEALIASRVPLYYVEHGVTARRLVVRAYDAGQGSFELTADLTDLLGDEETAAAAEARAATVIDRLLDELSAGVLRELSVVNAYAVRNLIEPGYGYHGQLQGELMTLDQVQRELRALEVLFEQIYRRARPQRRAGKRLAAALAAVAEGGPAEAQLPVYGAVRCQQLPEIVIELGAGGGPSRPVLSRPGSAAPRRLVLPPRARWFAASVAPWEPELPLALVQQLETEQSKPSGFWSWVIGVLLVGLLLGLALLLTR